MVWYIWKTVRGEIYYEAVRRNSKLVSETHAIDNKHIKETWPCWMSDSFWQQLRRRAGALECTPPTSQQENHPLPPAVRTATMRKTHKTMILSSSPKKFRTFRMTSYLLLLLLIISDQSKSFLSFRLRHKQNKANHDDECLAWHYWSTVQASTGRPVLGAKSLGIDNIKHLTAVLLNRHLEIFPLYTVHRDSE